MEIIKKDGQFVVPCREWAAIHLGKDITYSYRSKRNAVRTVEDPKRNTLTSLCFYSERLFTRVCVLETLLGRIAKECDSYDFDVRDSEFGGSVAGDDTVSAGGGEDSTAGGTRGESGSDTAD